ncbi:hypothetical protein [Thermoflexibacter ruber]|uniref:Uncharacterized protein n=1 Tax=Thermoflexibacter ruber TaxID=1003 RepID=A0A1I2HEH2_9BACT|nr:hypothetical protein [Thermoflexibacter ruber]SFF28009.1 hypothetical protein SAMN04488541_102355 [Thermoflexibacter ruber]
MDIKKIHYISGILLFSFIALHLSNHLYSIYGAEAHIQLMKTLRRLYRNTLVESILLLAVIFQIYSGVKLVLLRKKSAGAFFEKLHIWSGLYIAFFLVIHVSAVLVGRTVLKLDTNFYFGAAGINSFPVNLFFVPYYALAILSFFAHIASIHAQKMKMQVFNLAPVQQSYFILGIGLSITILIFYGLTQQFNGLAIPKEYEILTGKLSAN